MQMRGPSRPSRFSIYYSLFLSSHGAWDGVGLVKTQALEQGDWPRS